MTFRLRLTLLAAGAVAVAVVGAAVLIYVIVQQQLVHQIDQSLTVASAAARENGPRIEPRGGPRFPPLSDRNTSTGRSDIVAQSIDQSGRVIRADLNQPDPALAAPPAR
ncbi:MAG TPA: hypothetical protein VGT60_02855, partial [Candidatus Limnocylindria bacterium]|nr:hypothetical protein [Candidatus Limnocylindria bacterium]